jgi:hypothetical protein
MTLEINKPIAICLGGCDPGAQSALRAAPVMMDSQTPTTGLMRSVMPGRLPDYRGCAAQRRRGPPVRRSVAGTHRHRAPHPPTRWWPCVGGGDSTNWLWGFKSEGGLDHYAHVLHQRKLLVVG